MDTKWNWNKTVIFGVVFIICNLVLSFSLTYISGILFDNPEFNKEVLKWQETGDYPFPGWLRFIAPRIEVWPVASEVVFQLFQTIIWGLNGYILRRFFSSKIVPVRWILVPIGIHLIIFEPIQLLLGSSSFYYMAKERKHIEEENK